MTIKLEMLRCFHHVAQSGNLAEAARQLGRTQSAVSMTLKQLEDHLGQKLFQGERKNQLSAFGKQVFALAQHQVQAFDGTVREIETFARAPQGLLRIASVPSAASVLVPGAVTELVARHPGLKVDIRDMDSGLVIDALTHGRADVGIASGNPVLNGIVTRPLFEDAFGLVCSARHPLGAATGAVSLVDLTPTGFVGNSLCQTIRLPAIQRAMAATPVQAHNTFSLIGLLRTGHWYTILPKTVVDGLTQELVFRRIDGLETRRVVSVLYPDQSHQSLFVEAFCDALFARVPSNGVTRGPDISA